MNTTVTLGAPVDMQAAAALYEASFPPEERRPWHQIESGYGSLELWGVYSGGKQAGMVTIWRFDTFAYIEHFAIDPARRGEGIGAAALSELKKLTGLPFVLEVEPADHPDVMARRRIAFYERCGFALLQYDYIQPPYADNLPAVPLCLMSTDKAIDPALVARTLHRCVYGVKE